MSTNRPRVRSRDRRTHAGRVRPSSLAMNAPSPRFPDDFVFGVATSAYQVEGNIENDWSDWERLGKLKDDAARRASSTGTAASPTSTRPAARRHRLPPLARVGPHRAAARPVRRRRRSTATAAASRRCATRGIRPVVTLHHFTNPHMAARPRRGTAGERRRVAPLREALRRAARRPRRGGHHLQRADDASCSAATCRASCRPASRTAGWRCRRSRTSPGRHVIGARRARAPRRRHRRHLAARHRLRARARSGTRSIARSRASPKRASTTRFRER